MDCFRVRGITRDSCNGAFLARVVALFVYTFSCAPLALFNTRVAFERSDGGTVVEGTRGFYWPLKGVPLVRREEKYRERN